MVTKKTYYTKDHFFISLGLDISKEKSSEKINTIGNLWILPSVFITDMKTFKKYQPF